MVPSEVVTCPHCSQFCLDGRSAEEAFPHSLETAPATMPITSLLPPELFSASYKSRELAGWLGRSWEFSLHSLLSLVIFPGQTSLRIHPHNCIGPLWFHAKEPLHTYKDGRKGTRMKLVRDRRGMAGARTRNRVREAVLKQKHHPHFSQEHPGVQGIYLCMHQKEGTCMWWIIIFHRTSHCGKMQQGMATSIY